MAKLPYVLSSEDLQRETEAIQKCHDILEPLGHSARQRVIEWLLKWSRLEWKILDGPL